MITLIKDKKRTIQVGKNGVCSITEWSVNKDVVDIYRIADADNRVIEYKGFTNKDYSIEYNHEKPKQLSLF